MNNLDFVIDGETLSASLEKSQTGFVVKSNDKEFTFEPAGENLYHITVNGTKLVVETRSLTPTNPNREPVFSSEAAGAQVWLTRYGADYLVEFECNALEDPADTCIEEAEAMDIANRLIVVESQ